jgi:hypothetical protein
MISFQKLVKMRIERKMNDELKYRSLLSELQFDFENQSYFQNQ